MKVPSLASRATLLVLTTIGLSLLSGCTAITGDPQAAEIAALKKQLVENQRNATVGEVEVARLRSELAKTKAALRQTEETLAKLKRDATMKGDAPIAVTSRPIVQSELEEPVRPEDPAEPDLFEEPSQPAPAPSQAPAQAPPRAGTEDPQILYDRGYTLFHQKSYVEAEAAFRAFLERFPGSDLADNAFFWIGESYFARGDFQNALNAFAQTVARFPQGNKVSDALFKAGRCLELLGRPEEAANTYREIKQRYPGSVAATGAQERLDTLGPAASKG